MKHKHLIYFKIALMLLVLHGSQMVKAAFVHPGGVHSQADLDRMKAKVLANASPWIDGWNNMCADYKAQNTYTANPSTTVGGSNGTRQQAARDATAAYYNILRWYVTGDVSYANCAVNILNAWSNKVNAVVTGELYQLPIMMMVQAAEITRLYPGWASADVTRFKNMCLNYFYPACHSFVGGCGGWSSWDCPANYDILIIGIFCDDQAKFDEAVAYYKTGAGVGCITNMVCQTSGQVAEMGRDAPHAEIGPGCAAELCQSAYNQGVDLFSYSSNRLLAGFEYLCKYNLNNSVTWVEYNDCSNNHFYYPSNNGQYGISNNPQYEIIYNHYVVRKGLTAPYTQAMIKLRGIYSTSGEYSGYNALTYTLDATKSPFTTMTVPTAPTNLTATAGASKITLQWTKPSGDIANGYVIQRSTSVSGTYSTVGTIDYNTSTQYIDQTVTNGTTYYYKVASKNQAGTGSYTSAASATSVAPSSILPAEWDMRDIGTVTTAGTATFADANNKTFIVSASGNSLGGSADANGYLCSRVTGDFTLVARVAKVTLSGTDGDRVGIMMRDTLTAGAKMITLGFGDSGFRSIWATTRTTNGASASWVGGDMFTTAPVWLKLQRVGNVFTAYQSVDGSTWFLVDTKTITMATTYYVGMSVIANSTTAGVVTTAVFDNISTTGTSIISGTFQLINRDSGKCLDNLGSTTNGASVGQWTSGTSNNQRWVIEAYGSYYRLCCLTGNMYLDGLGNTADGSIVGEWVSGTSNNQQWTIVPISGSYYKLQNRTNGKFVDTGGDTTDGGIMKFFPSGASYKQQWQLKRVSGTTFRVKNINTKVDKVNQFSGINLYPNPIVDELFITTDGEKKMEIDVYTISGTKVYSENIYGGNNSVNLGFLKSGIYIVKVNDGQNIFTKSIIKR